MHKGLSLTVLVLLGCGPDSVNPGSGRCDDPGLQGELVPSPLSTALAISGHGFFVLSTSRGMRFTRWGGFSVDHEGSFVWLDHSRVQGLNERRELKPFLAAKSTGNTTRTVTLKAKLDPNATIQTFDPLNPVNTTNFNASVTIFDSLGQAHDLTVYFNRFATNAWNWRGLVPDGHAITGGTPGNPAEIATGTITFDPRGRLNAVTQNAFFNPSNAINPQPLSFSFGDDLTTGGTGLYGVVQNVSDDRNELTFMSQDGAFPGLIEKISIDVTGRVIAEFSNASSREIGRIALANFAFPRGLHRDVDGTFAETKESGPPIIGAPRDFLFGELRSQMIELPCQP